MGTWPNVRMAGADPGPSEFLRIVRHWLKRSLYFWCVCAMGRTELSEPFHRPVCDFLQGQAREKLLMLARGHFKSSIVSQGLPGHILIQEPEDNVYFPGQWGVDQRGLLLGESDRVVTRHMRPLRRAWEGNPIIRSLFPHAVWPDPSRPGEEWSTLAITVPRKKDWPDPSLSALGASGRITGGRPSFIIFDDLIAKAAMESELIMETAITSYRLAHALLERGGRVWTIGTPWTTGDLYAELREDATIDVYEKPALEVPGGYSDLEDAFERGRVSDPDNWSKDELRKQLREAPSREMFSLLYMLNPTGEGLTDFQEFMPFRAYMTADDRAPCRGSRIRWNEDARDDFLEGVYLGGS